MTITQEGYTTDEVDFIQHLLAVFGESGGTVDLLKDHKLVVREYRRHREATEARAREEGAKAMQWSDQWPLGTRVRKRKGSSWQGRVVGYYSTDLTPRGYAVESEREPGSVQIYPKAALEALDPAQIVGGKP